MPVQFAWGQSILGKLWCSLMYYVLFFTASWPWVHLFVGISGNIPTISVSCQEHAQWGRSFLISVVLLCSSKAGLESLALTKTQKMQDSRPNYSETLSCSRICHSFDLILEQTIIDTLPCWAMYNTSTWIGSRGQGCQFLTWSKLVGHQMSPLSLFTCVSHRELCRYRVVLSISPLNALPKQQSLRSSAIFFWNKLPNLASKWERIPTL